MIVFLTVSMRVRLILTSTRDCTMLATASATSINVCGMYYCVVLFNTHEDDDLMFSLFGFF